MDRFYPLPVQASCHEPNKVDIAAFAAVRTALILPLALPSRCEACAKTIGWVESARPVGWHGRLGRARSLVLEPNRELGEHAASLLRDALAGAAGYVKADSTPLSRLQASPSAGL